MNLAQRRRIALLLCGLVIISLTACGRRDEVKLPPPEPRDAQVDRGPAIPPDVSAVPDAVPTPEPLSVYGNRTPYVVLGRKYEVLPSSKGYRERGIASWYGEKFHGRLTSNRESYDMYKMTAAHKTLPLPTYARVTNLENGRTVVLRINDRGPFHENRLIDLSYAAAVKLGIHIKGTGMVEIEALDPDHPDLADLPPPPPPAGHTLFVQVGAYGSRDNARAMADRLEGLGFKDVFLDRVHTGGELLHRVRIGPLTQVEDADRIIAALAQAGLYSIRTTID
ncbi:septal ring lytic transglycosylase RlpA family lipoprotein [Ahniella affigens]|uniref:Endolytic peptidoglycan transglycosylase RlpA n=1 Tax=Ahniella affigens TaxID=2021234 RepID=A0A2P1PPE8_9GAMM|nr:septal ring lytic transglycosylase RlpA family protein [Ahniella affigens]AVP96720.1 septal ring lytic transglycosylase RlpA family lipoprotein [Ahniella affigens]